MTYPWDFETSADVSIDADDILEYVKNNIDWFLSHLNDQMPEREALKEISTKIRDILNNYDYVRVIRDSTHINDNHPGALLYTELEALYNFVESQID